MKIDTGVELVFENIDFPVNLFEDMEQIEVFMHEKMLENSKKEAASVAYAIEHDKMYDVV